MKLFRSLKTRCFECHNFPTFADDTFRVIGVPDKGRTRSRPCRRARRRARRGVQDDVAAQIALTAPYMHNGAFDTLEDVIKFYAKGGGRGEPNPPPGMDDKIGKFDITDAEIADLVAFLEGADRYVAAARSAGQRAQRAARGGGEDKGRARRRNWRQRVADPAASRQAQAKHPRRQFAAGRIRRTASRG